MVNRLVHLLLIALVGICPWYMCIGACICNDMGCCPETADSSFVVSDDTASCCQRPDSPEEPLPDERNCGACDGICCGVIARHDGAEIARKRSQQRYEFASFDGCTQTSWAASGVGHHVVQSQPAERIYQLHLLHMAFLL